jgi:hypothetical protein
LKKLKKKLNFYLKPIKSLYDKILLFIIDFNGNFVAINKPFYSSLGYAPYELMNENVRILFSSDTEFNLFMSEIKELPSKKTSKTKFTFKGKNNQLLSPHTAFALVYYVSEENKEYVLYYDSTIV